MNFKDNLLQNLKILCIKYNIIKVGRYHHILNRNIIPTPFLQPKAD